MPKKKIKTVARLKKDLWTVFSRYIRLRDAISTTGMSTEVSCITCYRTYPTVEVDAGHFIASYPHGYIRFDEKNVHAQCKRCNMNQGEQYLYGLRMIQLYGQEEVNRLQKEKNLEKKWRASELESLIVQYKAKVKEFIGAHGSPWA